MFIRAASRGPRCFREGRLNTFGAWIVQRGGRSWSTSPAGDHPAGLWHLAGAEPRCVQLAQEPPSSPTTVAKGTGVLPPAGCLCLLIIHTRAPRMPCVITSYAWAQPKGSELHLVKERRKKTPDSVQHQPTPCHHNTYIIWFGCLRGFIFKRNIDAALKNTDLLCQHSAIKLLETQGTSKSLSGE